jgi:hypothetical protein
MADIIHFVCSIEYNFLLKNMENYRIDLGMNYTKKDDIKNTLTVDIKDEFVYDFYKKYKHLIYKVATFGNINIYTCTSFNADESIIYYNQKEFKLIIDFDIAKFDIRKSFATLLLESQKEE